MKKTFHINKRKLLKSGALILFSTLLTRINLVIAKEHALLPYDDIKYLIKNLRNIKKNVLGGINLTCVGDERNYSLLMSKYKDSILDKVAKKVLKKNNIKYKSYSFLERGSDERQYNSPGIDLAVSSIFRSKYNNFKEYHCIFFKALKLI